MLSRVSIGVGWRQHGARRCIGFAVFVAAMGFALPAVAGLGGYVEYGLVQFEANWMDDGFVEDGDQAHAIAAGIAWDSNLAMDELLNYRFNVGFRHTEPSKGDDDLHFNGVSTQLTLGFSPLRSESMRVWLGPSIGVSYLVCEDCGGPDDKADVHQASIGLGPELGVNVHLDERFSVSVTARYTFESVAQKVYGPVNTIFDRGWQGRPSINFTFFLRNENDQFEAGGDDDDDDDEEDDYSDESDTDEY